MNERELQSFVCDAVGADGVIDVEPIQSLWSGYGQILRMTLRGDHVPSSVIAKHIAPPGFGVANPRGWSGDVSHARKLRSYEVETNWYRDWSRHCDSRCRVPACYAIESLAGGRVLVLEDLDAAGFPNRCGRLSDPQLFACIRWLANFHATFLDRDPTGLWETGTYWHLDTRPDEWAAMQPGPLKDAAAKIDARLSGCRFKTLVHGDAKVANFCFAGDRDTVAAVDFQYVGGGCGMKDLAYLMGSCLSDEQCDRREMQCLDVYFHALRSRVAPAVSDELEQEWRWLFPWAWADFHRFLCGWCATHPKLTDYSRRMVDRVLG
ncbi:oxidoreductase family protein [Rhodopirellula sp. JC639]|uniref:oxidoreductase family protein n=1 Tax=Stieleria mannarensis TaxID=2755585 RepID=UPI001603FB4A|nr:oxidoreductase family protein [Rhodopirellula sp. JC639]